MRRSRFSEELIIGILRRQRAVAKMVEVRQPHGVGEQSFYRRKSKYGGMVLSDARRPRTVEDENRRLKKILVKSMFDGSGSR
jgi:putative transposase